MPAPTEAAKAAEQEIREAFALSYAADADDPASATELSHLTNGWRACVMSTMRRPVAREMPPAAYFTLDEEGSPCMLFFDVVEARGCCAPGEEPEPLFRHAAPQASAEDDREALAHKVNLLTAESLGHRSAAGHLSALVDELGGHLIGARRAMADFQQAFVPAFDTPETLTMVPNEALVPFCTVLDRLSGLDLPQVAKDGGQQRAGDADDREAWAEDMVAAGAQHLGDDCWEWESDDFLFHLWQVATGRQQRAAFDHPVFAFLLGESQLHGVDFGERAPGAVGKWWWRKDLRAALSATRPEQGERDE